MYAIYEYDDLPRLVVHGLKARGWRWDADAQEWRQYNGAGEPFSPIQADHVRAFAIDVAAVVQENEAEQQAASSQSSAQSVPDFAVDPGPITPEGGDFGGAGATGDFSAPADTASYTSD